MFDSSWQKKKVTKMLQSLAAAYLANRQYAKAIEKFLQLKNLGDEDPSTSLGLAGSFLGLQDTGPEALQAYKQFCELYPEDGELISNIADLLLQNDQRDDNALHVYRCALAFHPPSEKDLHLVLLEAFEQKGDIALALQAARSAALLPGSDALAVRKLVSLSWRQQRFDDLLQELKQLPEQPRLAAEVSLYLTLTLAYGALHKKNQLSAKEIKILRQAAESLLPATTIMHARDYSTLLLSVAHGERAFNRVDKQPANFTAAVNGAEQGNSLIKKAETFSIGAETARFFDDFGFGASSGKLPMPSAGGASVEDEPFGDGQIRAVMVTALHTPLRLVGYRSAPRPEAPPDEALLALAAKLKTKDVHLRLFDDGLLAVARNPQHLVQTATDSLRAITDEYAKQQGRNVNFSMLIHAVTEDTADDQLRALSIINTALQLAANLPPRPRLQNEEAASTMVKPRLFITKKTLDLVSDGAKRLPGIRHTCPAGVSGPVMEVQEVLWRDPFEFVSERHPVPVGRFMVVKKLKDHGARTVFLARDLKLGVNAIFKSLTSRGARSFDEEQAMQSLRRVGKLAHPSLAIIHDMGKHDGVLYFVREFVEGHSLREEESFAKLQSLPKILTAGLLASRALQYAHREGVLHLNLKPTNCWITQDGKIKLTDFSLLGVHPETFAGRDDGRDDMYIAPEVRETGTASFASDVYSLAAIIFLMISHYQTAVRPHPDRFTPPTPDDGVPESVREVLFSAMAHDPDARPQSMAELERQLRYCQSLLSPQPF